jgi:hypothetical protein
LLLNKRHRVLASIYRRLLRLFSPSFQREFADEMGAVFQERLDAAAADGILALLAFLLHELRGLLAGSARQQLYARRARALLAASGGAVTVGDDGQSWRWSRLLLLLLGGVLLFRACSSFWYVTFDETFDVRHVALGDVNGDGRLDAFLSVGSIGEGYWRADRVVVNLGDGRFADSGQELGEMRSFAAVVVDINNNGHADILSGSYTGLMFHENDGSGAFATTSYSPRGSYGSHLAVAVADLNGDGSLDILTSGCCGWRDLSRDYTAYSEVWLNDGSGRLGRLGHRRLLIGPSGGNAVALGDLNGNGAPDAFLASGQTLRDEDDPITPGTRLSYWWQALSRGVINQLMWTFHNPNTIWFNDRQGNFSDSGQRLGQMESMAVVLGDVNGDGFLDAVVGNNGADEVWLNDGQGNFSLAQRFGSGLTWSVFLADLDGDGHLDLVVGGETSGRVWLNDGTGQFGRGQRIGYGRYEAIAVGDVTDDGQVDIFVAGVTSYQVWRGQGDGRFVADPHVSYR